MTIFPAAPLRVPLIYSGLHYQYQANRLQVVYELGVMYTPSYRVSDFLYFGRLAAVTDPTAGVHWQDKHTPSCSMALLD